MNCQKELKAAGKPYPRTCPFCLLGPCLKGHEVAVYKVVDAIYSGRRDGLNNLCDEGEYISLIVDGQKIKFSVSQAEAIAKDMLRAILPTPPEGE